MMFLGNAQVFGPDTTQEEIFEGTVKQPVQEFLDGYNRLIFTYGVTNAGKTYTYQGKSRSGWTSFFFLKARITSNKYYDFFSFI